MNLEPLMKLTCPNCKESDDWITGDEDLEEGTVCFFCAGCNAQFQYAVELKFMGKVTE